VDTCRRRYRHRSPIDQDATDLFGELRTPTQAAKQALTNGRVAQHFDVRIEFARRRMNTSGARIIAKRAANKRARVWRRTAP
jgi:hypothetical protein